MDLENIQGSRNLGGGGLVFMGFVHISVRADRQTHSLTDRLALLKSDLIE